MGGYFYSISFNCLSILKKKSNTNSQVLLNFKRLIYCYLYLKLQYVIIIRSLFLAIKEKMNTTNRLNLIYRLNNFIILEKFVINNTAPFTNKKTKMPPAHFEGLTFQVK